VINDSGQIAATSSAPLPALARVRRGGRASGREAIGDVVVSGRGRAPVAWNKGSASRLRGKFFPLQSLENSQNAEGISILPETVPRPKGRAAPTRNARPESAPLTIPRHCPRRPVGRFGRDPASTAAAQPGGAEREIFLLANP
jgi:hypothetical protein